MNEIIEDDIETTSNIFNELIEFQALGGIIENGLRIEENESISDLEYSDLKGSFEDPDFNNKHIEIKRKNKYNTVQNA